MPSSAEWTYDRLFDESDLVLIVEPIATRRATAADRFEPPDSDTMFVAYSNCRVLRVISGEFDRKEVEICHFRRDWDRIPGKHKIFLEQPALLSFEFPPANEHDIATPRIRQFEYLMFLKRDDLGNLICVSGQSEPMHSVKLMEEPPPMK